MTPETRGYALEHAFLHDFVRRTGSATHTITTLEYHKHGAPSQNMKVDVSVKDAAILTEHQVKHDTARSSAAVDVYYQGARCFPGFDAVIIQKLGPGAELPAGARLVDGLATSSSDGSTGAPFVRRRAAVLALSQHAAPTSQ